MSRKKPVAQSAQTDIAARYTVLQEQSKRLQDALAQLGLFFEAAHERDPLPSLGDLARALMEADELHIAVPAGMRETSGDDPHQLTQAIAINGRTVGRFTARRARPFDAEDYELAFVIGQLIGVVLEQSSLYSQVEQYQQQVQANTDTLDRLLLFERRVVSNLASPQQIALTLATLVPEMVGSERASLLLVPADQPDAPELVLSNGGMTSIERAREVRAGGLAGLVLRERRPIIIDETDTDRRWLSLEEYDAPTRCAMAAPLIWGDQILGVLTATTTRSRLFNTSHLNLLELIAHNISLALYSANLKARLEALQTTMAGTIHSLNNALQAAQVCIQQLLPDDPQEMGMHVDASDLRKVATAIEEVSESANQLNIAHFKLLALMMAASQSDPEPGQDGAQVG